MLPLSGTCLILATPKCAVDHTLNVKCVPKVISIQIGEVCRVGIVSPEGAIDHRLHVECVYRTVAVDAAFDVAVLWMVFRVERTYSPIDFDIIPEAVAISVP